MWDTDTPNETRHWDRKSTTPTDTTCECRSLVVAQPILKVVSQLLANLANGQHTSCMYVLDISWPDALLKLALANAPDAHEAACQTVYNCCRKDTNVSRQV